MAATMRGLSCWLAVGALACSGGNVASELARPPAFEPEGQSKCSVAKSQSRPLVVEWPASDRAQLEAAARRGLVAVRYEGCAMEVLSSCAVPGAYAYTSITPKEDRVTIRDADELYASIPIHAASFEGKLATAGELNVAMTIVGQYAADRHSFRADELSGDCARATHVVSGLTAGAFEFFAGADAQVGAGVAIAGAGAGARSSSKKETLNRDGDKSACSATKEDDRKPPFGCGALLRIEVAPIAGVGSERIVAAAGRCFSALDTRDSSKLDACYAAQATRILVDSVPPQERRGRDDIAGYFRDLFAGFGDARYEPGLALVHGDEIVIVSVLHGQHTGTFAGVPATNKTVGLYTASHRRLDREGLALEDRTYLDQVSFNRQLGFGAYGRPRVASGSFGGMTWVTAKNDAAERENLAAYRRMMDAFNEHDVSDQLDLFAEGATFRYVGAPEDWVGKDRIERELEAYYRISGDVRAAIDWSWAAGDWVVAASTSTGSNDGPLSDGHAATGKRFTTRGLDLVRFEGGKVKEYWTFGNSLSFATQLGLAANASAGNW